MILAYGLLEIPWVVYLLFAQARTGTAQNTHLAAAGLMIGGAVLCVLTALGARRSSTLTPVLAVMAAAWLASITFFSVVLSAVSIVVAAIPGVVAAVVVARDAFRIRPSPPPWIAVLVLAGLALLVRLGITVTSTDTSFDADRLRLLVVLWDSAEVAALLGLGLCLRSGAARAAVAFGSAGIVVFTLDAWVNITVVGGGPAFVAALVYAVVGEAPSVVMCGLGAAHAMRRWRDTTAGAGAGRMVA